MKFGMPLSFQIFFRMQNTRKIIPLLWLYIHSFCGSACMHVGEEMLLGREGVRATVKWLKKHY